MEKNNLGIGKKSSGKIANEKYAKTTQAILRELKPSTRETWLDVLGGIKCNKTAIMREIYKGLNMLPDRLIKYNIK